MAEKTVEGSTAASKKNAKAVFSGYPSQRYITSGIFQIFSLVMLRFVFMKFASDFSNSIGL